MSTPAQPLTRKDLINLPTDELKKIVHDPTRLAEVNAILLADLAVAPETPVAEIPVQETPVATPTPEEIATAEAVAAQAVADKAAADKAAAEAVAAAKAEEEAQYRAAGVTVTTDANGNITKLTMNYQAKDDAGNPIGRQTYLEAHSWLELVTKQRSAHENAVRYSERIKKQQITKKKDAPAPEPTLTEAELLQLQEDLKGEDRAKATKAAEAVRVNDERKKLADAEQAILDAQAAKTSFEFLSAHISDLNRCEANLKVIRDYIFDNNLEWTRDNLEAALTALESQLVPFESPIQVERVPAAPANPAPVAPVVVVPPPAAITPPAPPVAPNPPAPPVEPAVPAAPPAPRPGVNGGLVPGAASAPRPSNQPPGLTKADIANMPREEYRRRLKDPKFVAAVNALRITHGLSQRALASK